LFASLEAPILGEPRRHVDLNELLQVLWRRKITVLAVAAITIGLAVVALRVITPVYESSATLALTPEDLTGSNQLIFFGTLDAIVPVYADAASSRTTQEAARRKLGRSLAPITVDTFKGTGLMKIKARSTNRFLARDTVQTLTDALLERTTTGGIGIKSLRLVELDRASLPTVPVFPRKKLSLIVAGLLGFALGIGVALLRENLTTKVETSEDLARVSGVPSFAEIPREASVGRLFSPEQLATETPLRGFAEALRDLRTNLLFSEGTVHSLVVTSPEGSHGKTTVAFGLAATLARAGTRTVLVDADLRRGRVSDLMEITRSPGLMEVLLEEVPLEDVVRPTTQPRLSVITGGRRVGDPTEVITVAFEHVLTQLEGMFEAVIIDGTPVVPISDARIVARFADATLLVVSAGAATRRQVRTAIDRLSLIDVRPTATVLNNSREAGSSSYYYEVEHDNATREARRKRRTTQTR
jgi:capsular exopolysaccharide synthesis family protein